MSGSGYRPMMIEITARMMRGILIDKGGSLILESFAKSGFKGPKNILFAAQKVYAAVNIVAKIPKIAITSPVEA